MEIRFEMVGFRVEIGNEIVGAFGIVHNSKEHHQFVAGKVVVMTDRSRKVQKSC